MRHRSSPDVQEFVKKIQEFVKINPGLSRQQLFDKLAVAYPDRSAHSISYNLGRMLQYEELTTTKTGEGGDDYIIFHPDYDYEVKSTHGKASEANPGLPGDVFPGFPSSSGNLMKTKLSLTGDPLAPIAVIPAKSLSEVTKSTHFEVVQTLLYRRIYPSVRAAGTADQIDMSGYQPFPVFPGATLEILSGDFPPQPGDVVIDRRKYFVLTVGNGNPEHHIFQESNGRPLVVRWSLSGKLTK